MERRNDCNKAPSHESESARRDGEMVRMSPRLQKGVNAVKENELRRMEGLPPVAV